ncbi:MAG TPA: glycoside hydrolase family 3 N-terminal domain-containing protein [Solirubrobacterales bacterium]|nr:glycoside hydrolase family 3 N-terminal domain-containing protein [Solirubrobacterales bacterium]
MDRATATRRRAAFVVLALAALLGLASGIALGAAPGEERAAEVEVRMARLLSPAQLAGERLVAGVTGTAVSPQLRQAIRAGRLAGVVLFAENFPSRASGRKLIRQLQAIPRPRALRAPLLVMVDQEGGEVVRLSGAPSASAQEMGERGGSFSQRQGRLTAANLRDVGANVDLAPVLDVARPGGVIAATERAFGTNPRQVATTAVPFARGLEAGGVVATAKHFPGLGAATENTDFAVQEIDLSKARLRLVDETPYEAYVRAGGRMVMLSTAIYPAFSDAPAAFTRAIATGELRRRLGFRGVSITDALETVAVDAFAGRGRAGVAAARAGVDLLLFTDLAGAEAAQRALLAQLRAGKLDRAEFLAAAGRVLDLRAELPR